MQRRVYLEGELGAKFGTSFVVNASTMREVFGCMDANYDGFKKYLIDCHENNIGFAIDVADKNIEHEPELLLPLKEGDITITAVPAGSKGFGKILAAVAIVAAIAVSGGWLTGAMLPVTGSTTGTLVGGVIGSNMAAVTFSQGLAAGLASMGTWGTLAMGIAANLAMTGLAEMMAPDPAKDADQESSYMFNGSEQNVIEGDPVPVLYGRLRVPGQPIIFDTITGDPADSTDSDNSVTWMSPEGNIYKSTGAQEEY